MEPSGALVDAREAASNSFHWEKPCSYHLCGQKTIAEQTQSPSMCHAGRNYYIVGNYYLFNSKTEFLRNVLRYVILI